MGSEPGSSPRSRGPRSRQGLQEYLRRFIPAFAGTTWRCRRQEADPPVHPRVRGDHYLGHVDMLNRFGSSPRSRGPHGQFRSEAVRVRFIPAFAGTTPATRPTPGARTVHPRVRGDHYLGHVDMLNRFGSSPRSRGPPGRRQLEGAVRRFIPAFAGTTWGLTWQSDWLTVHPRVRGDHHEEYRGTEGIDGSSPRSRGPLPRMGAVQGSRRFIPAFAGTTRLQDAKADLALVHPRVRGDHGRPTNIFVGKDGSSPRSRGPRY